MEEDHHHPQSEKVGIVEINALSKAKGQGTHTLSIVVCLSGHRAW
jgi:hypothetical protein